MTDTKATQQTQSYQSPKRSTQTTAALQPAPTPDRHSRKCAICHHEDREEIEQALLHWVSLVDIKYQFDLHSSDTVRAHAIATGLFELRRRNMRCALERIIEKASNTKPTADAVIRAIRAYSLLDNENRWIDPPRRVIISHEPSPVDSRITTIAMGPSLPLSPPQAAPLSPASVTEVSREEDKFQSRAIGLEIDVTQ